SKCWTLFSQATATASARSLCQDQGHASGLEGRLSATRGSGGVRDDRGMATTTMISLTGEKRISRFAEFHFGILCSPIATPNASSFFLADTFFADFLACSGSFFCLTAPQAFFCPDRGRRRAQRRSRMARLRATASAARSVLDGREHDGRLDNHGPE